MPSPRHPRNGAQLLELGKASQQARTRTSTDSRNGAQLLELGKGSTSTEPTGQESSRNGAQLLELGKAVHRPLSDRIANNPQWSPAFGAGKRARDFFTN